MIKKLMVLAVIFTLLLAACAPAATPTEAPPAEPTEAPVQPTEAPVEPTEPAAPSGEVLKATPGQEMNMVFLPKNLGNAVFDEAQGGFACIPAFIGDVFGTRQLAAIYGYILTAWAAAGLTGPMFVAWVR